MTHSYAARPGAAAIILLLLLWCLAAPAWAASPKPTNADCLACHTDPSMTKEVGGKQISLAVDEQKFANSIHGQMFACVDCHTDLTAVPHDTPKKVSCATCHEDAQKRYGQTIHSTAIAKGLSEAASCTSCHGNAHEILPSADPTSKTNHANIPATCASCHAVKFTMERSGISAQPVALYNESVHGKALAAGNSKAAVCTDCHGSHDILGPGNPQSKIFKFNVPQTCATCHEPVKTQYTESIHGKAIARGNWQSPVCTDCHGIHSIKKHIDPNSSVAAQNLARTTCTTCHDSMRVTQEYGFDARRSKTYEASYHGMASKLGSTVVANCASCHGVHNILPSSDPKSTISKQNLAATCGVCHPGANEKFTQGKVHIDVPLKADFSSIVIAWIRRFYLVLILATIGGMVLHNFLVWRKKALAAKAAQLRTIVRLTRQQRVQHAFLLTSFITLVITGFALAYPDSWLRLFMGETFRYWGHRVAGIILISVGLYHAVYLAVTAEGRSAFKAMLPTLQDAFDLRDAMLYYAGWGKHRPAYGRFNYAEKAEYWALVWGWMVMAATGLAMWFKVSVASILPRWTVDVATAIHFYEAVLASLAIVVWHFYGVIFDPDVYPLNWAFWDGKISNHLYEEEHPLDMIRALKESGAAAPETEPATETEEPVEVATGSDPGVTSQH